MPQKATSISIKQLSAAVNKAVAAAAQRTPSIPIPPPNEVSYFPYLILGFPVPDAIAQKVAQESFANLNAFANDVAGQLGEFVEGGAAGAAAGAGGSLGAIYSAGGHIIMGRWIAPPNAGAIRE